ncbi:MAG: hypothetical protein AVDCRST_MAG90-1240 [uncultured Microvirga sp.]|uniref:Uncharacterized protein n=1 Tax=uncultured Microvirga sp. TaxID=412392 RepID=A0A6J4L705_9HYPH|nr:MAG: hypothetical protein AVDCRST_MAG90-1240 [uncultured Microvirga sp.]
MALELVRDHRLEPDLHGIGGFGEDERDPVRDPEDMRVDRDGRLAESVVEDDRS